jgi:hypothetical protein
MEDRMNTQRWLSLAAFALSLTLTLTAQESRPTFEVASVLRTFQPNPIAPARTSPDTFYRAGETLSYLVRLAHDIQGFQLIGGPDWVRSDRFEIHAKSDRAASPDGSLPPRKA